MERSRKKLVAGNWKMHGDTRANERLLRGVVDGCQGVACEVLICPPFPYLSQVVASLEGGAISVGAQNVSEYASGAYTGEVSSAMLVDLGCRYVIVGHSERRSIFNETDEQIARKCEVLLANGLVPILCVGETLKEREEGVTIGVVVRQLDAVLALLGVGVFAKMVVAYEPVWAIGTGKTASSAEAQAVHAAIRSHVAAYDQGVASALRILYGGSVKPQNAKELFGQPDIDGGLIGGAALIAEDFVAICQAAD